MKKSGLILSVFVLVSCASTGGVTVLERADHLSSSPSWASITNAAPIVEGKLTFIGYVEVDADASKSAAANMADEKARTEPFRALVDQYLEQNQLSEDLRKDSSISQRIISSTRGYLPPLTSMSVTKRYWEVVRTERKDGTAREELRFYSLAEVNKNDFENAKKIYFQRLNGNSETKAILTDVGAKQRDAVLNSKQGE